METFLPLVSAAIIPFIPNNILRYAALTIAVLAFIGSLVYSAAPGHQVAALEKAVKSVEEMFNIATEECVGNPRFIYEAELKLVGCVSLIIFGDGWLNETSRVKRALSILRITTIDAKILPWIKYLQQLRHLLSSITLCRHEVENLQSMIQLEIELTRQQRYEEDMRVKKATLDRMFVGGA
ncbi:hypothetical protein FB45DRAFT_42724 [Roridomyces roridus]|uniref:Uncharacterized protein n=1 Tax=Roridomyces roridus TaxID=1738132 RepID=A0AAD7BRU1_9AGAR|nr:hypothetical protein FB45DRAFT_42724 [Roridomyces roridus]